MFKTFLATLVLAFSLSITTIYAGDEVSGQGFSGGQGYVPPPVTATPTATPPPAGGGGGGSSAPTTADLKDALDAFVTPTQTNHFSLGNLNSGNEASLYINNDNGEGNIVFRVIRLIAMLVGTVAILLYIIAGYFMIFSQGDENQLTKGKQIVTYTSLGLVLAFTAYMIVQLVMGLMYFAG